MKKSLVFEISLHIVLTESNRQQDADDLDFLALQCARTPLWINTSILRELRLLNLYWLYAWFWDRHCWQKPMG